MGKLTKAMINHLRAVQQKDGRSAYPGLHMRTLEALEARELLRSVSGRGSMFSPSTAISWFLTDAGRAAIAKAEAR